MNRDFRCAQSAYDMAMHLLCLCTGNTCRSPMLMTLVQDALDRAGRSDVTITSAGTAAGLGDVASSGAKAAMARRGLNLAAHRSRPVATVALADVDQVWCMSSAHAAAARSRGVPAARLAVVNAAHGGVPDPFGGDDAEYEACALVLAAAAQEIVAALPRP